MYVNPNVGMYVCVYVCICMYMYDVCMYESMYDVCMYVCIFHFISFSLYEGSGS